MIRVILVETSHPGNIGAVARAMKTMGLSALYLVSPKYFPHEKATAMAAQATDILERAIIVNTLQEALSDCQIALGISARPRTLTWPILTARAAAERIRLQYAMHKVALVFGREHSGLTNEELQLCQYQVQIPVDSAYSSLNLAAAVQVICYELYVAALPHLADQPAKETAADLATLKEIDGLYVHLEQVIKEIEFIKPLQRSQVINRLRRLFSRTLLEQDEINILRGMLTAIQKKINF